VRIALLLNDVDAVSAVESFMKTALAGIENMSFVVTVSAHVYMTVISDVVIEDYNEVDNDSEYSDDADYGSAEEYDSVDVQNVVDSEYSDAVSDGSAEIQVVHQDSVSVDDKDAKDDDAIAASVPLCSNCGNRPYYLLPFLARAVAPAEVIVAPRSTAPTIASVTDDDDEDDVDDNNDYGDVSQVFDATATGYARLFPSKPAKRLCTCASKPQIDPYDWALLVRRAETEFPTALTLINHNHSLVEHR
jgi:hypothetical protein